MSLHQGGGGDSADIFVCLMFRVDIWAWDSTLEVIGLSVLFKTIGWGQRRDKIKAVQELSLGSSQPGELS